MKIWFEEPGKKGRFEHHLASESIASLTYTCFLTTVCMEEGGRQISRPGVPLLGLAEEFVRVLDTLQGAELTILDWLGGEVSIDVTRQGEWVTLLDPVFDVELKVTYQDFATAVSGFCTAVFTEFVGARRELLRNREYLDWSLDLQRVLAGGNWQRT